MKDITALRTLFCALVRSQLEYSTVVWSIQTARNINKLEKIQKRATKFILKSDDDYNMHRKTKFVVFGRHMLFVSVLFLSKVLNRYIGIDISTYTQFYTDSDRYHFRRRDELTLKRTFVRTTTFKKVFSNRIVDMWNKLPLSVHQASNISSFKKSARDFLLSRYD